MQTFILLYVFVCLRCGTWSVASADLSGAAKSSVRHVKRSLTNTSANRQCTQVDDATTSKHRDYDELTADSVALFFFLLWSQDKQQIHC